MPARPQRPRRSTVSLAPWLRQTLEERGARGDKSHGPFNYTIQLTRTLARYDTVIARSDPRETAAMPPDHYELVVDSLTEPLDLEDFHISRLGDYLFEQRAFQALARERRLDPRQVCDTLNGYPFAEKLHLVDTAQVRHAPPQPRAPRPPRPHR